MAVPEALSRSVRSPAHGRGQYCLRHESLQGAAFHIEHVISQSKGESTLENLALAYPDAVFIKPTGLRLIFCLLAKQMLSQLSYTPTLTL
jgi:HNH endonuclease